MAPPTKKTSQHKAVVDGQLTVATTNNIDHELENRITTRLKREMRRNDESDFYEVVELYRRNPDARGKDIKELWGCAYPTGTKANKIIREEIAYARRRVEESRDIALKTGQDPDAVLDSDLSAKDLVRICDNKILKLTAEGGNETQLLKWMDFKSKIQNLRSEEAVLTVDPEKLLGFQGLMGMTEKLVKHLRTLALHRNEVPEVFAAMCEIVDAVRDSPPLEEGGENAGTNEAN